ncbi:MAG: diacylglycerol kinase family protein [Bacteroidota bacterium]
MSSLFLINPASGRKQNAAATQALIEDVYAKEKQEVHTQFIDFETLDQTLDQAIEQGIQNIYAVGGDGTVNAVGTRLIHKPVNFGVIPKGSGNGYARNIGFSIRTKLAITQSLSAQVIKVDTGEFSGIPFLNVAGIGLDAEVAYQFSLGDKRGFVPYVKRSAEGLIAMETEDYVLELDGKRYEFSEILGIVVANGTQWGYDVKISTNARLTDGLFDVLVVKKFPILKAGLMVKKLFSGKFQNSRYVEEFQAKKLTIRRKMSGAAQVDGEPIQVGDEIGVCLRPQSLNLLLPGTLTPEKIQSI